MDMRNFTDISVDSSSGNAIIGTGNRLGNIALALNDNGRALPHGTCPYVGIGGHSGNKSSPLITNLSIVHFPKVMAVLDSHLENGASLSTPYCPWTLCLQMVPSPRRLGPKIPIYIGYLFCLTSFKSSY